MVMPSPLEKSAEIEVSGYHELSGMFPLKKSETLLSDAEVAEAIQAPRFGQDFTEHMTVANWDSESGWNSLETIPFGPLSLSPAAMVLHYGQEIFEGMKAYRHADGSVWTFRPEFNAARFNASARRLAMPEMSPEMFIASLIDLVQVDKRWVPSGPGASLYLRPFMIATEGALGVKPASTYSYLCIASPAGSYFANGFAPVSIWVSEDYHRAGPGGMGAAKTGGNYAASLLPQRQAKENGCAQVCFLDAATGKYLEELGGMNVFVVYRDGSVRTPRLTGTILEGGTRRSIIKLLEDCGHPVEQTDIAIDELVEQINSGEVTEMFACGTAAVVAPIEKLVSKNFSATLAGGRVSQEIHDELTGIQFGLREDRYGWMYRLA
ncbi:branched-chain amino acid aminotransferase [Actinomycetaceae bacterium TAE3-ERU4]|nr:branched-chain amino acid aminotransferase [Actinomycetaceae bacterium TAE3-ERU4]